MADKEPRQPTHRAYSVIRREGQDDYWLNIGLVFPHKDNGGFNIMLQAFPLDGKIVCREIVEPAVGSAKCRMIPASSGASSSTTSNSRLLRMAGSTCRC